MHAGFVHELNQDKGLYNSLVRAMDHHDRLASHSQATTSTAGATPGEVQEDLSGYTREAVLVGRLLVSISFFRAQLGSSLCRQHT